MFCPRCASSINETLKFCKSCGLPIQQIVNHVVTGGLAPPVMPLQYPPALIDIKSTTEGMKLRQKKVLTILGFVFGLPAAAMISEALNLEEFIVPIAFFGMIIGIVWATFRYKMEMKLLEQRLMQQGMNPGMQAGQPTLMPQQQSPAQTGYLPPQISPQAFQSADTNPLRESPHPFTSVVEDETQRLPHQKKTQ